ncbi:MAG TPA: hypothetical protein VEV15_01800 [Flavisolibacter sp.]|nr:hypothetical protein [Flavisolibacter sp.]
MFNLDPNAPQVNQDQEAIKDEATEQAPAPTAGEALESASMDQAMGATQDSEEGSTEG